MAETINMPKLGFDMAEGTLVRWVKKEGEAINKGEVLAEIETDKATVEVESSASGVLRKLLVEQGAVVPINTPIAIVGAADEKIDLPAVSPAQAPVPAAAQPGPSAIPAVEKTLSNLPVVPVSEAVQPGLLKASPLAKKMAQDQNLDLSRLQGTGPGGRVVRRDIEAALAGGAMSPVVQPVTVVPLPVQAGARLVDQSAPMTRLRSAIARRMVESKTTIPHFYVTHEYNAVPLLDLRKQINGMLAENEKISVNDFIVKAAALALHQFPNLNASLNGNVVNRHGQVNLGIAVSVEGGLLTVVCRDADLKPLRQISAEVRSMAQHVREGKVRSEEIEGSTFSISNMGMYDVENFSAIINPPEAAILAVGTAREMAVIENGEVKPGWRMKITIAVDHRISDGVEAAKFMQAIAAYLEEPLRLLL